MCAESVAIMFVKCNTGIVFNEILIYTKNVAMLNKKDDVPTI